MKYILLIIFSCTFLMAEERRNIILIAGKKSHGPVGNRIHDYGWSVKLLKTMLENSNIASRVKIKDFYDGWPEDQSALESADTIMIISDGGNGKNGQEALHIENEERLKFIQKQMMRGCGLITFHYSTFAPDSAAEKVMEWNGGYFDWQTNGVRKWYSSIKTVKAKVSLSSSHAVLKGVKPFEMKEEFYYNIRFKENDKRIKPLWTVPALDGRDNQGKTVSWALERKDGGRGFATSCGHFYDNWKHADFRKTILNAIAWTAKIEVPAAGVEADFYNRDAVTAHMNKEISVSSIPDNFKTNKLVAWCIVPFDSKKRSPEARAQMVKSLGLTKVAYDWRKQHVKQFEEEILAYKKHGIEYFAFWGFHPEMNRLIKKHGIKPQLWMMLRDKEKSLGQADRIEAAAKELEPKVKAAAEMGLKIGLYNHGGWAGEPSTMAAVCKRFHDKGMKNVGIIYNFHHGHAHFTKFKEHFNIMKPWLLCLNLNGMNDGANPKILELGKGSHETEMIKTVIESGYKGPIGILDHQSSKDSEEVLKDNIKGLENIFSKDEIKEEGALLYKDGKIWREPLNKKSSYYWKEHINRDRIYDFYAKQALFYGKKNQKLIPGYPGIDSGKGGHWGNQNDRDTWSNGRVSETDFGSMIAGVIKGKGLKITKGYSITLQKDTHIIFDAEKKQFIKAWKGKNLSWSPVRHGLIRGLQYNGGDELKIIGEKVKDGKFKGFYRVKKEVYIAVGSAFYKAVCKDGRVEIKKTYKPEVFPTEWPQTMKTIGKTGSEKPYALDTFTLPYKNPWNTLFFLGGLDALSKDRIAICTMHGEVWICDILKKDLSELHWKRFASGLHQPLGLKVIEGVIHVMCRDQITALHDFNSDDEADFYESVSTDFTSSPGGHDYVTGLQTDNQNRFYMASGNQGVVRIDRKNGKAAVLGSGLRNPNGLAVNNDGSIILTSIQEGNWTPASAVCDISSGNYFGYGGPKKGLIEPMLYLPRGIDNSSGGQIYINSDQWGPLKGQWVHLSMGYASSFLLLREKTSKGSQAAAVVLPGEFLSGVHRGRFSPFDGQLYVAGSQGWGNYGLKDGCLQRVRFTGGSFPYPTSYETRENGIILTFSEPQNLTMKKDWFVQNWNYFYSAGYGSKEFSVMNPSKSGHDHLEVNSVQLLEGGRKVFLEIPQLRISDQLHIHHKSGLELFATVHEMKETFTKFNGYTKIPKIANRKNSISASDPKIMIQACVACHHKTQKAVGPPLSEIRKLYKGNPQGIVNWAMNPQVKNPQLPPMPSFKFMGEESLKKIADLILLED